MAEVTVKEVLSEAEERMKKSIEATRRELATIRTGRASPDLLAGVRVDYYGTPTPLNQLALISAPEPRMLVLQPYDPNVKREIARAIEKADLGVTVKEEERVIRVFFPELSEETRQQLTKVAAKKAEEGKVAIRNIRRDAREKLKEMEDEGSISEDEFYRAQKQLDELTERYIEQIEELRKAKEEEIMTL